VPLPAAAISDLGRQEDAERFFRRGPYTARRPTGGNNLCCPCGLTASSIQMRESMQEEAFDGRYARSDRP
jgi:hypothetical protein